MSVKAIWFDFGGVLSPPIEDLFTVYQGKTGISRVQMEAAMEEIARPMGVHPLAPIELAMITQIEWGRRMREALTRLYPGIDLTRCDFDNHGVQWFSDNEVNAEMIRMMHEVQARGLKACVLTNNVIEWEKPWRAMVNVDHFVDAIVDSCKVGTRKPEPLIFRIAAERVNCAPQECLLIDDVEENCRAARKHGWHAILFRDNAQVVADLRRVMDSAQPLVAEMSP
jgi:putative hydrolase of the HAD superfamily